MQIVFKILVQLITVYLSVSRGISTLPDMTKKKKSVYCWNRDK